MSELTAGEPTLNAGAQPPQSGAQAVPEHPRESKPYKYTWADRLYLPLLQGLAVTARHFFKNLIKSKYTISYPEERREYSGRYRGHHILTTRPDGSVRCVACFLCATNCPAECIQIEAAEQPDVNIEKYPVVYEIDMLRCIFCGFCQEVCPEEAIFLMKDYSLTGLSRKEMVYNKEKLLALGGIHDDKIKKWERKAEEALEQGMKP
jgi:NADH-quinone oxidoreductase subunit I